MYLENFDCYFLPRCPSPESSMTLEYYTDILESYNGTEERISLRPKPWCTMSYRYVYTDSEIPVFNSIFENNMRKKFMVPMWYFLETLEWDGYGLIFKKTRSEGVDIYFNQDSVPYVKLGGILMLTDGINFEFKLIDQIHYYHGVRVRLADTIDQQKYVGWKACAAFMGEIVGDLEIGYDSKYNSLSVSYHIDDLADVAEESVSIDDQIDGVDIYSECLIHDQELFQIGIQWDQIESSNALGIKKFSTDKDGSKRHISMVVKKFSKYDTFSFIRWLQRRLGSYRPFIMPTYTKDMDILSWGASSVTVSGAALREDVSSFALKISDEWIFMQKDSVTKNSDGTSTILFSDDFIEQPTAICYALPWVISENEVTIDFSLGNKATQSVFSIRSVR